jgi:ankyrin repeat protein
VKDQEGSPLLLFAVDTGSAPMVSLLLEHGADVKVKDQYGLTALVYAMKKKHPEIVKIIKDAGGSY